MRQWLRHGHAIGVRQSLSRAIVALVNNMLQIPKIDGKLLPPIVTSTGVKQGDNLSPILLDTYLMMLNLYLTENVSLWY